jgi:chromosome segregation ATPase
MLGKKTANSQKIFDANRQLADDKKTCQTLDERHESCLQATVSAEERVNELKTTLLQLAEEQKEVESKNDDLSNEMEVEVKLLSVLVMVACLEVQCVKFLL